MAGYPSNISSDNYSSGDEIGKSASPSAASLKNTRPPAHSDSSESESDVRETQQLSIQQQRQLLPPSPPVSSSKPRGGVAGKVVAAAAAAAARAAAASAAAAAAASAAAAATHPAEFNLQLIPCQTCAGSLSYAHCLTAKSRDGECHVPRLKAVKDRAHPRRSKAVLLPGQKQLPPGAVEGSTEDLPLSPENLALRFRVPCELCTTLAMCSNNNHPQRERTLAEIVGDYADGKTKGESCPEVQTKGHHHLYHLNHPEGVGRRVKEEARSKPLGSKGGGEGEGATAEEADAKVEAAAEAGTGSGTGAVAGAVSAPGQKGFIRGHRVCVVEGQRVMMPRMVSVCDGVVLSLCLAPVLISSELRADVPGDFAVSAETGTMSKGGYHFARLAKITIANVLKLRALRDVISWKHNATKDVHPTVAAKVLNIWEKHHPAESKVLDTMLQDRKADKDFSFRVPDGGPASTFKASDLRTLYARRSAEAAALINSFTEEQINSTTSPGGEHFYEHELPDGYHGAAARVVSVKGEGGRQGFPRARVGGARSKGAAAAPAAGAVGASTSAPPMTSSSPLSSSKSRRRSRVREVVASDGKCYSLPLCIREKASKLNLYVSLRTHRVNGAPLFVDTTAENAPLQKPYGRADITRENLLALRAVRDLMYRNPVLHPIVAADAFEIWESITGSEAALLPDADKVEVTGAATLDGVIPRAKFTAGELRKLRGAARRAALDVVLGSQLSDPAVMAGSLEEVAPTAAVTAAATGARAGVLERPGDGSSGDGRGGSTSKKRKGGSRQHQQQSGGAGGPAVAVPFDDPPATAVSSAALSSSSPSTPSAAAAAPVTGGTTPEVSRAAKRNRPSSRTGVDGGGVYVGWLGSGQAGPGGTGILKGKRRRGGPGGGHDEVNDDLDDDDNVGDYDGGGASGGSHGGGRQSKQLAGEADEAEGGGGGGEGGASSESRACVRRESWLQAVHENDWHQKRELERLRKEKAKVKEAHLARSVELMKWMVDEQSGRHEGTSGPPPARR